MIKIDGKIPEVIMNYKKLLLIFNSIVLFSIPVMASDGLISIPSQYNNQQTTDRLEGILIKKGMTIFNRIKHSDSAKTVGISLNKTELIIFGNPKIGSKLMKCHQLAGIDLPLKALIWDDDKGQSWISYNEINYLQQRHQISGCEAVLTKMTNALHKMVNLAAAKQPVP